MRCWIAIATSFALASAGLGAEALAQPVPTGPLSIAQQGSFFVGGRDVRSDNLSTLPAYASSGTITIDQMYVRYQVPTEASGRPLVLIHGCCLTGKTWETTPDGRMGWDEYFVRRGHPVYVVDQVWRGRSAADPSGINAVRQGRAGTETLPTIFSASHESAWAIFRFGTEFPKTFSDLQFPIDAQGEFWKQMVPDYLQGLPTPNPTVPALSGLARKLEGAVLVSHSQSGIFPFQTAVLSNEGIAGIVAVEPAACPVATDDMVPYRRVPVLVVFGDHVDQFPRWAPRLAGCRAFVQALSAAGGQAELLLLPDLGIRGNSHMLMQDRNNLQVADLLLGWMDRHAKPARGQ